MPSESPRTIDVGAWPACFLPPPSPPTRTLPLRHCPHRGKAHARRADAFAEGVGADALLLLLLIPFSCFGACNVNKERNFLRLHTTLSTADVKQNQARQLRVDGTE